MLQELNLMLDKIQPVLNELATKLGVASEYLWGILIKQQYVEAVTSLGGFFFGIGLLYVSYRIMKWGMKNLSNYDKGALGFLLIPVTFGVIMICTCFTSAVYHLINPEYQALKDIFELLTPKQ